MLDRGLILSDEVERAGSCDGHFEKDEAISSGVGRAKRIPSARSRRPLKLPAPRWQHCSSCLTCQVSPGGTSRGYFYKVLSDLISCGFVGWLETFSSCLDGKNNRSSFSYWYTRARDSHVISSPRVMTQSHFWDLIGRRSKSHIQLQCVYVYMYARIACALLLCMYAKV